MLQAPDYIRRLAICLPVIECASGQSAVGIAMCRCSQVYMMETPHALCGETIEGKILAAAIAHWCAVAGAECLRPCHARAGDRSTWSTGAAPARREYSQLARRLHRFRQRQPPAISWRTRGA